MPNFRAFKICRMYWILKEPQNTEQRKQVWFYTLFSELRGIRWPTTNPQIDLNRPKQNPYLNQANQKILPHFPTQKIAESNPKSPRWLSRLFNPRVLYPLSLLLHGPLTSPDRLKRYRNHTKYGTVSGSLWRRSSRLETSSSRPSYKGKSS